MTMRSLMLAAVLACADPLQATAQTEGAGPAPNTSAQTSESAAGTTDAQSEDGPKKPWPPWTAAFSWSQGYAAAGLSRGSYQTFDPTYSFSFLLTVGYNFDQDTALTLNQYAVVELTDSDTTTSRQQFQLWDTSADLSHKRAYTLDSNQHLTLAGSVGLVFPTSKASQAATLILGTRARAGVTYRRKDVLHGFDVGPSVGYQRRWNSSNTVEAASSFPCALTGRDASQDCASLGSVSTTRDVILLGLDSTLELTDQLVAGLSLTFFWTLAHSLGTYEETATLTGPVTIGDASTTHWRNSRWLLLSLGYRVTDWFTATARIIDIFAERGPNGRLRGPFNPLDTVLGLELSVSFDQLYSSTHRHATNKH
jgi:hypothetical protein